MNCAVTGADVIVVGGGPGGCAVALEAARGGASVLLLEATEELGGNAARSTGYLAFAGTRLQREAGIEDDAEAFLADMCAEVERQRERYGIVFDEGLARLYAERSADASDLLVEIGFRFGRLIPRPKQHRTDRMVSSVDVTDFRTGFTQALIEACVDVSTSTKVSRLIQDRGRVVGVVIATDSGEARELRAGRGVVLAAGGYQANAELRRRYQPEHLAATPYLGLASDRGDGHLMGQAVGGDLINMTMIPPLIMAASAVVERVVAVDLSGQRFHDEAGPYDDRVAALLSRPERRAWYVYDDNTAKALGHLIEQMPEPPVYGRTLSDLAVTLGVPDEALERTVSTWNRTVEEGTDQRFGRVVFPADRVGILAEPFHAVPMCIGINFPAGGFRVTRSLQVIDIFGTPIPGLFAVGDCVGGIAPAIGLGGVKITSAITLGQVAGRVLAGIEPLAPPPAGGAPGDAVSGAGEPGPTMDVVPLEDRR